MKSTVFKRKVYDRLLEWKQRSNGRTAVLVQGARRVGKSTIVEEFARKEYKSYILIDFSKASAEIKGLFDDLMDLNFLFLRLQAVYQVTLHQGESVLVFDEVQCCPRARQAIKHLVADGRYHYIETGSLISIKQNTKDIIIPSEEERIDMFPLDFEEFLWAIGDEVSFPLLRQFYERKMPLGPAHRSKEKDLRIYMLVGGMPQAVQEYLSTNNLSMVDRVKRSIIQLYYDDFMKIDPSGRLGKLFLAIPGQLSKNNSRYVASDVLGNVDSSVRFELLANLEDSKTVLVSYHADDPNIGMSLTRDLNRFKIFLADTGLFVTLAFWDKSYAENVVYQKLLLDKLEVNMGYIYENLVAQMLAASGYRLFYYTFPKDTKHNYEIDFLLSLGSKIAPIEVKSSGYKTHASLDAFCQKFSSRINARYLVYTKDYGHDGETLHIPFYMVPML
jgi:predicted AAA+ superfamily ATPase